MAARRKGLASSIFVLIIIGSIGFLNLSRRPRFQAFHSVDVLQLLATGMCYGFALAGIAELARRRRAE